MTADAVHVHVTAPCGDRLLVDDALLEEAQTSVALRCPACGEACSTRALIEAARLEILQQLSEPDGLVTLAEVDGREQPWLGGERGALETCGLLLSRQHDTTRLLTDECRAEVEALLDVALGLPPDRALDVLRSGIREPTHRHDLRLDMTPPVRRLLAAVLAPEAISSAIEAVLGPRAECCECSCIVSEGGARAQAAHCDTLPVEGREDSARLITLFVALQDIEASMGPTLVWPRTHTPSFHEALGEEGPLLLRSMPAFGLTLDAGDAVLMDSRVWHSGGANTSGRRRCVLVCSFAAPGAFPEGSTYSMLPQLIGKHTLRSLRDGNGTK